MNQAREDESHQDRADVQSRRLCASPPVGRSATNLHEPRRLRAKLRWQFREFYAQAGLRLPGGGGPDDCSAFGWPACENASGVAAANPALAAINFKYSRLEVPLSLIILCLLHRASILDTRKKIERRRSRHPHGYCLRTCRSRIAERVRAQTSMQSEPPQDSSGIQPGLLKENVADLCGRRNRSARLAPREKNVKRGGPREYGSVGDLTKTWQHGC
jgi:hypothetical protein